MKGQASVELIVVLAVALVILAVMVFAGSEQLRQLRMSTELQKANGAVSAITGAADFVNSGGVGSRQVIRVAFPDTMSAERSFVKGKLVNIAVYTGNSISDVNGKASVELSGSLPKTGGEHIIVIESKAGAVLIQEAG